MSDVIVESVKAEIELIDNLYEVRNKLILDKIDHRQRELEKAIGERVLNTQELVIALVKQIDLAHELTDALKAENDELRQLLTNLDAERLVSETFL